MRQKLENYGSSFIENIAAKRQHNVEWAKSAVRESASITAAEALKLKVIDLMRGHSCAAQADQRAQLNGKV